MSLRLRLGFRLGFGYNNSPFIARFVQIKHGQVPVNEPWHTPARVLHEDRDKTLDENGPFLSRVRFPVVLLTHDYGKPLCHF